ncbi:unnamed protein product [Symbiodinium microadriaticum]|nr:unnamed protein product [Symbiodinium microadriaticum]CAE7814172.1 unnamed protein product [Symbiodinium sp. KB8]
MFDRSEPKEGTGTSNVGFCNMENPRLRAPPKRLRQRLCQQAEDSSSTLSGGQLDPRTDGTKTVSECEALPGASKTVPMLSRLAIGVAALACSRARLRAVDTGEADPEGLEAPAVMAGPIPKEKAQPLAPQATSTYVPPVTIDPTLLWSSRGKPLPPRKSSSRP